MALAEALRPYRCLELRQSAIAIATAVMARMVRPIIGALWL